MVTGASSGIGRETATEFGQRGASVVLAARNEAALGEVAREVERLGGTPSVVVTDVAEWEQVDQLAREAVNRFGRIDTWVNVAAIAGYGTVEQMSIEEIERQIQVILMSQIYGVKAALPYMKRERRGTIVNVGSVLGVRSVPLQAAYCAAKGGIKGFTESLRLELEYEEAGINVTLILPSSVNTPLFSHARSRLGVKPKPIPPVYEPRVVAEAILFAAEHPRREIVVGGGGKMLTVMERLSPSLLDRLMLARDQSFRQQMTDRPDDGEDNFFGSMDESGSVTGEFGRRSRSTSLYTRHLEQYPNRKRVVLSATTLIAAALVRRVGR